MGENRATVEITASSRKLDEDLRSARRKWQFWAKGVEGDTKRASGGVRASFLGNFGADVARRGLDMFVDAGKATIDYERSMTRLQIAANRSAEEMLPFRAAVADASRETGIGRDEILGAAQTYVALTGDMAGAQAQAKEFARVAQASGAAIQDVAQAGAAMQQALELDPKQADAAFSAMIVQGKAGAVELKDLSAELSSVAPQFAGFAGSKGIDGVRKLGAALQIVRKEFKGSAETATGLRALMTAISGRAVAIKRIGGFDVYSKVRDSKGNRVLKDFHEIITAISNSKIGKDKTLLKDALSSDEAIRAFNALSRYSGEWDHLAEVAQDAGAVTRDFNTYMASDAGRLDGAMNRLKLAIADAFTPERIGAFVSAIEGLAQKMGPIVDGVANVADKLGYSYTIAEGIGANIRGLLSDDGNPYGGKKYIDAKAGLSPLRFKGSFAEGVKNVADFGSGQQNDFNDKAERARQRLIADHDTWAATADDIVYADNGAESVRRAMAHYYKGKAGGYYGSGTEMALGSEYLTASKVKIPDQITTQVGLKIQLALITEAIKAGFAGAQTHVNIDGQKAAIAVGANRPRTRPGG